MKFRTLILLATTSVAMLPSRARAGDISLGSAANFAVLAGASVTNTGLTVVSGGNVGGVTSITGFGPGTVTAPYTTIAQGSVVMAAVSDLTTAYDDAAGLAHMQDLSGEDLGGMTLTPGVYYFSSAASLTTGTATLTLNDEGNANAQFVFQIGTTLTTAVDSEVVSTGSAEEDTNVFWQIGTSATLAANTSFEGNILADTSVTVDSGAKIEDGSAMAIGASVTLDDNIITSANSVPEPTTITLGLIGATLLGVRAFLKRSSRRSATRLN